MGGNKFPVKWIPNRHERNGGFPTTHDDVSYETCDICRVYISSGAWTAAAASGIYKRKLIIAFKGNET